MKRFLFAVSAALIFSSAAQAATLLQCSANKTSGPQSARIHLIQNAKGELNANVNLGSSKSGTTYAMNEIAPGIFQGVVKGKGKEKLWMKLFISNVALSNKSIQGTKSQFEVVYPTGKKNALAHYKSHANDIFVCGKKK